MQEMEVNNVRKIMLLIIGILSIVGAVSFGITALVALGWVIITIIALGIMGAGFTIAVSGGIMLWALFAAAISIDTAIFSFKNKKLAESKLNKNALIKVSVFNFLVINILAGVGLIVVYILKDKQVDYKGSGSGQHQHNNVL